MWVIQLDASSFMRMIGFPDCDTPPIGCGDREGGPIFVLNQIGYGKRAGRSGTETMILVLARW